jgi:hypothetical protein
MSLVVVVLPRWSQRSSMGWDPLRVGDGRSFHTSCGRSCEQDCAPPGRRRRQLRSWRCSDSNSDLEIRGTFLSRDGRLIAPQCTPKSTVVPATSAAFAMSSAGSAPSEATAPLSRPASCVCRRTCSLLYTHAADAQHTPARCVPHPLNTLTIYGGTSRMSGSHYRRQRTLYAAQGHASCVHPVRRARYCQSHATHRRCPSLPETRGDMGARLWPVLAGQREPAIVRAVFFGDTEHGVLPVTSGRRATIM